MAHKMLRQMVKMARMSGVTQETCLTTLPKWVGTPEEIEQEVESVWALTDEQVQDPKS